jgi:AcrR family transcriptional regulator
MLSDAATVPSTVSVRTPWGRSESLRDRRLRPGPGTPAEEVAQNQRERLFGAMVACVAKQGYTATRVTDLVDLSGVSRRSFYELFSGKEECFRDTIEAMLSAGIELALAAESEGTTWEERAVNRFQAFASLVAAQPAAARMCLIEAHAAGAELLSPVEEAIGSLERITQERFAESPQRAGMPAEMTVACVGATLEIARTRLHCGEEAELPGQIPELMELLLSYRPPAEPLRLTTRPPTPAPETLDAHDHGERALRALAAVAAEKGYANARVGEIVKRASMSPTTFYANFSGKEDLLTAAIDSAGAQVTAVVMPAFRRRTDWPSGVRAAFGALFSFLASRPTLAQLVLVEVHAAGPEAVRRRDATLRPLEAILDEGRARTPEVSPLWVEAITGGLFALAHWQICRSGPESLPALAPDCTYFTLAPFVGPELACAAANGDGRSRRTGAAALPHRLRLPQLLKIFNERIASVEELSRELDVPERDVRRLVGELRAGEMIEVAEERTRDGEVDVYYRASPLILDDEHWAQLSLADRQRISAGVGHLITGEIDQALQDGSFDARVDRYLTRLPVRVDEQGWRELMAIHEKAFRACLEAQERSAERLRRNGEAGVEGRSVQALFEPPKQEPSPD